MLGQVKKTFNPAFCVPPWSVRCIQLTNLVQRVIPSFLDKPQNLDLTDAAGDAGGNKQPSRQVPSKIVSF